MDITEFVENEIIPNDVLEGKTTGEKSLIVHLCCDEMGEDGAMVSAYFENIYSNGYVDLNELISEAMEAYYGSYSGYTELAEELVSELGYLDEMPEHLRGYFDYEKFGNDLRHDFWENGGCYFRNY